MEMDFHFHRHLHLHPHLVDAQVKVASLSSSLPCTKRASRFNSSKVTCRNDINLREQIDSIIGTVASRVPVQLVRCTNLYFVQVQKYNVRNIAEWRAKSRETIQCESLL